MSDEKPVPTKPGAYYLEDGRAAQVRALHGVGLSGLSHGQGWVGVESMIWATDEHGNVVPVPTLEEWRRLRADDEKAAELVDKCRRQMEEARRERAEAIAERDEARAKWYQVAGYHKEAANLTVSLRADRDALLSALDVPEGVDAVEWAGLLASWWRQNPGPNSPKAKPPRPLPDGPGDWWGRYGQHELRAVRVCWRSGDLVGIAHRQSRPDAAWVDVKSDRWTWLAGPDGRAVRCTPPEVTHDND